MKGKVTAVWIIFLCAAGCGEGRYDLYLDFPDEEAKQLTSSVTIWVMRPGVDCNSLIAGSTTPQTTVVLAQEVLSFPVDDYWILTAVPTGDLLFFAEAGNAAGAIMLRGCTRADVKPGQTVEVAIRFEWICRPGTQDEIPGNQRDDDCDGQIDECQADDDCEDGNSCTADSCEDLSCQYQVFPDGTNCNEGNACYLYSTCISGHCSREERDCSHLDGACTTGVCDPLSGACEQEPVTDGGPCDDGSYCTVEEQCQGSACVGAPRDCPSSECHRGVCEENGRECTTRQEEDGVICSDGLYCTEDDSCQGGVCAGIGRDCDDADRCTEDSCDAVSSRCLHNQVLFPGTEGPGGDPTCANDLDEDCDGLTDLDDQECEPCLGQADCDDLNPCTTEECIDQVCQVALQPEGTGCDDGNACTMQDACSLGMCQGVTLDADADSYVPVQCGGPDCDDGNPSVNPGMDEGPAGDPTCIDLLDNDCDGKSDVDDFYCTEPSNACSRRHWCWINPLPQANDLNDVWASGPDNVWAVGDEGTILHWDGLAWQSFFIGAMSLNTIHGTSANDIWAGGQQGLLLHYDGTVWQRMDDFTTGSFDSIWARGPEDVWAVKDAGIVHWDGLVWTQEQIPVGSIAEGIWGAPNGDIWVVGRNGIILHKVLGGWTSLPSQTTETLVAVWGSSASDVWAAGNRGTLLHWSGSDWQPQTSGTSYDLRDISGSSSGDVWISSAYGNILHWDGSSLSLASITASRNWLHGVWVTAGGEVWAVGSGGSILHWSGLTWDSQLTGYTSPLHDLWGQSPDNLWAVGLEGLILLWDGADWSQADSGTNVTLYGVWGVADQIWAVGNEGTILHRVTASGLWVPESAGTTRDLADVWGTGVDDVWAVGQGGTILHWNGANWSPLGNAAIQDDLYGVWAASTDAAWAGGANNTILSWNGQQWTRQLPIGSDRINCLFGIGASDVWACNSRGGMHHWNGTDWSWFSIGQSIGVWSIWGLASDDLWAAGIPGEVLHWDGTSWSRIPIDIDPQLNAIWGFPGGELWAAGDRGAIVRYIP